MFCLAQLASIAGAILCVYQSRKWFGIWMQVWGDSARPFPWYFEALVSYGWLLIAAPIACVLLIPRHREDECSVPEDWRWPGKTAAAVGGIVLNLMIAVGFEAIFVMVTG